MTHVCPWTECGQKLPDNHMHSSHERWAADPAAEYVARRNADGTVDVVRVPREKVSG